MKKFALALGLLALSLTSALAAAPQPNQPVIGGQITVSATNGSSTAVALPKTGTPFGNVTFYNGGAVDAYYQLGDSTCTATTSAPSIRIPAGGAVSDYVGANTYVCAITGSSTATVYVWQSTVPVGFVIAGSGGGGGGGNVTVVGPLGSQVSANGVSVTIASDQAAVAVKQGTAANLNATVVGTGTFADQSTLQAGSAIVGKVGIDQTTPGTTNGVQVNAALPAGTNLMGKVGIDQTTVGTTNAVSVAQIGANTVLTGNGTTGTGSLRVTLASDNTANSNPFLVQPVPGTANGLTPYTLTAAASTNATNIKASAGLVDHISVYNNSATLAWVSFYDTASTPTCGTSIKYQVMIPANSTNGAGAVEDFAIGVGHTSGIGICVTTGIAGTGNVAASAYVVNVFYK